MPKPQEAVTPRDASAPYCPVLELRQYTLHPGKRDTLIELFDREFVESQEAVGMRIVGQFRDADAPERFVWLRGFEDMGSREAGLKAFYGGPIWKANREHANATMVDSSDVLLLRPVEAHPGFSPRASRPPAGATALPSSLVVATLYFRDAPVDAGFLQFFEREVRPLMTELGAAPEALFQSEYAENTFPALPVRTGEHVLVSFSVFPSRVHHLAHLERLTRSKAWNEQVLPELRRHLKAPPQQLKLEPTARSWLR